MDVCVITYRNTVDRVLPGLRAHDRLWVRDNTDDNVGFARAANELAKRGSDPLILFVNPDGDPQPGCFGHLEEAMSDPEVVAAAARSSETGSEPARTFLPGACLVVRRDAFEWVGGFDESLFMYGEDADLSWKLEGLGRLVVCDDAVFLHVGNGSWRAHYRQNKNGLLVEYRWGRPVHFWPRIRFAFGQLRCRRWSEGSARLAGVTAFSVRWMIARVRASGGSCSASRG